MFLAGALVTEDRLIREKQASLLTHIPHIYMGDTQGNKELQEVTGFSLQGNL